MKIHHRIQCIVNELFNGNKAAFSKHIGIRPTTLSNIIGKEKPSKPSSEILENIMRSLPELNAEWLLTGEGNMMKTCRDAIIGNTGNVNTGVVKGHQVTVSDPGIKKIIEEEKITIEKDLSIYQYQLEIDNLKSKIKDLERIIEAKNELIGVLKGR